MNQEIAALIVPLVGTALLAIGIYRRRAYNRWNRRDDLRLLGPQRADAAIDDRELPSQPSGRGTVFIVIGVMVLILGALHVLSYLAASQTSPAADNIDVGQCITAAAFEQRRVDFETVDCDHSDATLELVSKGDATASCPDGSREDTKYPALINDDSTQCFILNLREGQCYALADTVAPVTCSDPTANVRVVNRVDGAADWPCSADARTVAFREPPRVYCFVAP